MTYAFGIPTATGFGISFFTQTTSTTSKSSGTYQSSPNDFINWFYSVLRRWRSETAFESDPDKITSHPSYKALVNNAELITPLIIDDLRVHPSLLVWVLDDTIEEKPYSDDVIGNIPQMTNAWIAWADRNERRF